MASDVDEHLDGSTMDQLDDAIAAWADKPGGRLLVTAGPQTGKTTKFCYQTVPWLLANEPDLRIVVATYSHTWAQHLGMGIRYACGEAGVNVGPRAVRTVGVCGPTPSGSQVDVLIVDDPFRNSEQAQSQVQRDKVWAWWQHEALTRLMPDARVLVASRQWHDDDLAGRLLAAEPDRWDHHVIA